MWNFRHRRCGLCLRYKFLLNFQWPLNLAVNNLEAVWLSWDGSFETILRVRRFFLKLRIFISTYATVVPLSSPHHLVSNKLNIVNKSPCKPYKMSNIQFYYWRLHTLILLRCQNIWSFKVVMSQTSLTNGFLDNSLPN
jgi:hypothetical protein